MSGTEAGATLESADILDIMRSLPHRYPFLLVDRIVDIRGDESCVGIKNVTVNEPQFTGHFPERPVMPGVLLIEAMAQTAGVIVMRANAQSERPKLVYFMTIDAAKFRKPVTPGDRVEFHMTKTAQKRNIWWYRGRALVDGALVCEAQISAMMGV
ncbi:3-hydroxyacyl-ACP dehydratase FabZ [Methylocystis iwaonis]|uniref:3-hydroxyacyl-[acyl-carrier-protein] dehydratase FabZ n=1 Tax=Methylocystis iwaonis TaxID=2885079 RepID=A0ABM8EB20_9HYPH|nr:3-hydroxyacyl-ACP dehydratase FabZ [Methylocystis iwaonis]BDV35156.1 3-hydroxyacyl-[acyl-carrier-protein] dehydratase FabZ [Methylocystis iwaonis]